MNVCRATGFTTRSDIGPARDADDIPYVPFCILFFQSLSSNLPFAIVILKWYFDVNQICQLQCVIVSTY